MASFPPGGGVPSPETSGAADFFHAQRAGFGDTIARFRDRPDLLDRVWTQAFSSFERNVEGETQGLPQLACHKGCGTCCQLQVVATTPEVLMVARYVRAMAGGFRRVGVDLDGRLAEAGPADAPAHPMALGRPCPFLAEGLCVIYPVRPMACRGHASFDKEACVAALCGGQEDVPVSGPHRAVRGLVQSALQAALHEAGLAWGVYDLAGGVRLALACADGEAAFRAGADVLAPAAADGAMRAEMGAAFGQLGAIARPDR
ncbi:YkgJ family cysteine cluster protein [Xanthobacter sp. KR7-225]|uniref:YkgJ family cysteine cluster protein n=1 Tax=Xanthobacter sp. KR7-225 TaxID=3156613 RepID=UPI0032B426CC